MTIAAQHDAEEPIRMCLDWPLPDELDEKVQLLAPQQNPHNIVKVRPGAPIQLAGDTRKFWAPGTALHIRFLDKNPPLATKVADYARIWLQYANLQFVFDDSPSAQIRISFTPGAGCKSRVGLDALQVPPGEFTMNLDPTWFTVDPGDVVLKRTVLHEFGHTLGFIHEHQSPKARILWNVPKVMAAYTDPSVGWTPEQIRYNVLDRANTPSMNATQFDDRSIMLYPIDPALTSDGFGVGWNNELSAQDKMFAAEVYPRAEGSQP